MTHPSSTGPAVLSDFTVRQVTVDSATKTVYLAGSGPAVILMPEMPGISPDLVRFAGWIRDAGFTVYLPSLFGTDGAYPTPAEGPATPRSGPETRSSTSSPSACARWRTIPLARKPNPLRERRCED